MKPWSLETQDVLTALDSRATGLRADEVQTRLDRDGLNVLHEEAPTPAWKRFLAQFKSAVIITLLVAAVVSGFLGDWIDTVAILLILILNAVIGYVQEAKAEQAVAALKKLAAPHARVIRDGHVIEVPSSNICRGDVLLLEAGDFVVADARMLVVNQLCAGEASLTGESLPVRKQIAALPEHTLLADRLNMLFGGTVITGGSGHAVVTSTGMETELGKIAQALGGQEKEETPLQERLRGLGNRLLLFALVVTAVVALLGWLRGVPLEIVLMSALSLAVAAIPEGLPAVVTLALALAVRRMAGRKAIVRQLPAVETLGSTTVICTDKTGTLTTGEMIAREWMSAAGTVAYLPAAAGNPDAVAMLSAAALCSNASLTPEGKGVGDSTEVAILAAAVQAGIDLVALHQQSHRHAEWAFDSDRKRMSVVVTVQGKSVLYVKGAPEAILSQCAPFAARPQVEAELMRLSGMGHRVLAVARRLLEDSSGVSDQKSEQVERDLDFLGCISISDPPRPEALESIRRCRAVGIKVVMITGDHPVTAGAIAKELGIVQAAGLTKVVSGADLEAWSDDELKSQVASIAVYARVSPQDKLRIIRAWKSRGDVVAMTGDGVNDAPALKEADIGVAMGKAGTEVARQASAMVLADDNFATIVTAVEEGRAVHGNIRRTIRYLLTGNMAEILVMLAAAIAGWPIPLLPLHLLWINLVTDGVPTLALAAEPVPPDALQIRPEPLGWKFYRRIILVGLLESAMTTAVYGYTLQTEGELMARTYAFSFLVFAELFRSFAARSDTRTFLEMGPAGNLYHLAAVLIPFGIQVALHRSEVLRETFRVAPLGWNDIGALMALALIPVTVIEVGKLVQRAMRKSGGRLSKSPK